MDKQIIIDGVDVSECKYYDDGTCCNNDVMSLSCENTDCIYKQLKRLERQYENVLKIAKENADSNEYRLQELEQENERLKKLKFKSDGIELLQDANLNLHNANVKYRQALQEIREICKNSHTSVSEDYYRTADKIQAKINEVIGAE